MSFINARRGSGSKNASSPGITRGFRRWRVADVGVAATGRAVVTAVAPRHRHPAEGGVRDVVADPVTDRELRAAVDVDVLDDPVEFLRDELGERVPVLVHVVVGVEGGIREAALPHVDQIARALLLSHRFPLTVAAFLSLLPHGKAPAGTRRN